MDLAALNSTTSNLLNRRGNLMHSPELPQIESANCCPLPLEPTGLFGVLSPLLNQGTDPG